MTLDAFESLLPGDPFDLELLANIRPGDWANPKPSDRYNLVVLGAGTAGLVCAAIAAGLGARVALVEKHLMGGDCLNVGCVPSKAILRASRAVAAVRLSSKFGVEIPKGWSVDFGNVMARMRRLRAGISLNDSAARFQTLGVDVYLGEGRFSGPETIEVDGQVLRFARAAVCTGARAALPSIPGLKETNPLTNASVFNLTELPRRLGVIGGGPIGCELAQAFARFGSRVTLFQRATEILPRDDPDAAVVVRDRLALDGVHVHRGTPVLRVERSSEGLGIIHEGGASRKFEFVDAILLATGRAPNVETLGLDAAGVAFDGNGIKVDDHLRTTNPRIYAAGDVTGGFQFTHAADAAARILVRNALFRGRAKVSALTIPWCTYTDPELAHVGLSPEAADARRIKVRTFRQPMGHVDRAILDGDTDGFVKVHVKSGTDRILGATAVGRNAGDWISELTLAMVGGLGLKTIAETIHPYPTQAEAIKKLGDAYGKTRLTPLVKKAMSLWLGWTRS